MQSPEKHGNSPDPILVGLGGLALILLGVIVSSPFIVFCGLCICIISVILLIEGGRKRLPSLFELGKKIKTVAGNVKLSKSAKTKDKQRVLEEKQKKHKEHRKYLEEEEKQLATQINKLHESSKKSIDELEEFKKELKNCDFSEEDNNEKAEMLVKKEEAVREEKIKMEQLSKQLNKVQAEKQILQKQEESDAKELEKINLQIEDKVEPIKEKKVLNTMDAFGTEEDDGECFSFISLKINNESYQLLSDEELNTLVKKKKMKCYNNFRFRQHCDDVYFNELFFKYHNKIIPLAMVDGAYFYRDSLRIRLCNGDFFFIKVSKLSNVDTLHDVFDEFCKEVLRTPLLGQEKMNELLAFSENRFRKMVKEYQDGILQPLDYVLGDKNV